jgi:hypothetical protein
MDEAKYQALVREAREQGFDVDKLVRTVQKGEH